MTHAFGYFECCEQIAPTYNQHQNILPSQVQAPSQELRFEVMAAIKLNTGVVLFSNPEFQSLASFIGQDNQTLGLWQMQKMFCQNLPQGTRCMNETIIVAGERVDLTSVTKLEEDTLLWMVVRAPTPEISMIIPEKESAPLTVVGDISGRSHQISLEQGWMERSSSEDQDRSSGDEFPEVSNRENVAEKVQPIPASRYVDPETKVSFQPEIGRYGRIGRGRRTALMLWQKYGRKPLNKATGW